MGENRCDGRKQNRSRVSEFAKFHFAVCAKTAPKDVMRLNYFIVHEDADARQSRRIAKRLKSSGAMSVLIRDRQREISSYHANDVNKRTAGNPGRCFASGRNPDRRFAVAKDNGAGAPSRRLRTARGRAISIPNAPGGRVAPYQTNLPGFKTSSGSRACFKRR